MTAEKTLEISVQILCALINQGFVPAILVGKNAEGTAGMVRDHLYSLAKEVVSVYKRLETEQGDV